MNFTRAHLMRAFPRLTLPLVIGLVLALPLAACGNESGNDGAVADHKLVGQPRS